MGVVNCGVGGYVVVVANVGGVIGGSGGWVLCILVVVCGLVGGVCEVLGVDVQYFLLPSLFPAIFVLVSYPARCDSHVLAQCPVGW